MVARMLAFERKHDSTERTDQWENVASQVFQMGTDWLLKQLELLEIVNRLGTTYNGLHHDAGAMGRGTKERHARKHLVKNDVSDTF